jgi:hypothetical protein
MRHIGNVDARTQDLRPHKRTECVILFRRKFDKSGLGASRKIFLDTSALSPNPDLSFSPHTG